jgi:hypothetical protein
MTMRGRRLPGASGSPQSRKIGETIWAGALEQRQRVDAPYRELKQEVEGLRELREITQKAQLDIAAALHIKQLSVSKIKKRTEMYLATFRSYIEAIGGKPKLAVNLSNRPALKICRLGEVAAPIAREHRATRGSGCRSARFAYTPAPSPHHQSGEGHQYLHLRPRLETAEND